MTRNLLACALSAGLCWTVAADGQTVSTTQPATAGDGGLHQGAATRDADMGFPGFPDGMERGDRGPGEGGFGRGGRRNQMSEKDLAEAKVFMAANSPIRYKAIEALPNRQRATVEDITAHLFINLRRLRDKDPELYAVVVGRTKLEDDIYGLRAEFDKTPADQQADLKGKLREKVAALFEVNLTERKLRLNRLAATLSEEQERLAADSKPGQMNAVIEKRLNAILSSKENNLLPPPPGPHPRDRDRGDDNGPGMK